MDMIFRPADLQDYEEVCSLFQKAIGFMRAQNIDQWDEIYPDAGRLLADIQNRQMYLVTEDGAILSAVVLNEVQDKEYEGGNWLHAGGKFAVVHRLCVHPGYQNKKVGRRTMLFAEDFLAKGGYGAIRLDAFLQNPRAVRLYEGLGYRHAGNIRLRKGEFFLFEKPIAAPAAL